MPISRIRLTVAVVLSVLFILVAYLVATTGVDMVAANQAEEAAVADGEGSLPRQLYNPPDTVPTTSESGPTGRVSIVFPGTEVRDGLFGEMADPWIAVSSTTGAYRAIDAPHLPGPSDAPLAVSAPGDRIAWGSSDGVLIYDAVDGTTRELSDGLGGDPRIGPFSPDGGHVLAYDGSLHVVDVESGEVAATVDGLDETAARQAVWTPDGSALTYVVDGQLVAYDWQRGTQNAVPASFTAEAKLAWHESGRKLAVMRDVRGVNVIDIFEVEPSGELQRTMTARPRRFATQRLLGFTNDTTVSVVALSADSGAIESVYRVSTVDDSAPTRLTQLASPGLNWLGGQTMAVAAEPLASGAVAFDEPRRPWSDQAKLLACALAGVFLLGLYLTRRLPRRMRRA
jgi:hypothetical protein